ncbi:hypothetical protein PVW48_19375 [Dinoroseobacter sp. PD6]|uniref:hypothetical protein n=1 Tax=Dinoroseobacter sp. PD6 TaxID=3028384 RepID=UPI00237AFD38|nr:hypothetical protein [Dinoroseobacter sp. PD6]MDD9718926.1 hypothetical protein [Dinoroseobacter sp. PD6]
MAESRPVVILATQADLAALEEDLQRGRRRKLAGFSVQVPGLAPHDTLAVQRALDGAYLSRAGAETMAAAVLGAGAALAWGLGPAGLGGSAAAVALCLGGVLGAAAGRRLGLWAARRRIAGAVARLRRHFTTAGIAPMPVAVPAPEVAGPRCALS